MERDCSVVKLSDTGVAEVGGRSITSLAPDVPLAMSGRMRGAVARVYVVAVNTGLDVSVVDDRVVF